MMWAKTAVCLLGTAVMAGDIRAAEWSGFAAVDVRLFPEAALFPEQNDKFISPSVMLQPEFRHEWNSGTDRLTVIPFGRYDSLDKNRSHWDVREFNWLHQDNNWDIRAGVGKVFWGVTESRHLVDIINQTDFVENINSEEKLGQPMVNLNISSDYGNFSLFYLPYFRERTFPAPRGRVRFSLPVDEDNPEFNGVNHWHQDFAGRWSRTFGDWDIGVAYFRGVGREPRLTPRFDNGPIPTALTPTYDLINQTSLDVQGALGNWLLKLEAFTRGGQGKRFAAVVGGFEYTHYGIADRNADLGLLMEYLYDGRDQTAPPTPFNNDLYVGARLALNDEQNSQMLVGVTVDLETQATVLSIEASRRIGDKWRIELEARLFKNIPPTDILTGMRQDDYVQLRIARFF
jgi:hypothetical protein